MVLGGSKSASKSASKRSKNSKNSKNSKAMSVRSVSKLVPAIMLQQDVLHVITEKLAVKELLICSLVSKAFLQAIDTNNKSDFGKCLRFWCLGSLVNKQKETQVHFNSTSMQCELKFKLSWQWQQMWMMHIVPRAGQHVQMRLPLQIPLDQLCLRPILCSTGRNADYVEKIKKQGHLVVDALEWQIKSVTVHDEKSSLYNTAHKATVVMLVTSFLQSQNFCTVTMLRSISVTFEDVPVLDKIVPLRVLCVLKCFRFCLHCKQRPIRFESLDNVQTQHRLLCSACIDHLYVRSQQLETKWKIHQKIPDEKMDTLRHFFTLRTYNRYNNSTYEAYLLKSEVASFLGHSDWTAFLTNNRRLKHRKDNSTLFDFNYRWL